MAKKLDAKLNEKKTLEDILGSIQEEVAEVISQPKLVLPEEESIMENRGGAVGYINLNERREKANSEAEDMINYMVEFYLGGEILNSPYVKKRMDDDKERIAGMIFNIKATEHSIAKLVEVIDEGGAIVPRNFEVLAKLQSSMMEIVKHYEAFKTNMENNYKAMNADFNERYGIEVEAEISNVGYGSKELLSSLSDNMDFNTPFNDNRNVLKNNLVVDDDDDEVIEYPLPKGVVLYDRSRAGISQDEEEEDEE